MVAEGVDGDRFVTQRLLGKETWKVVDRELVSSRTERLERRARKWNGDLAILSVSTILHGLFLLIVVKV